MAQIYAFPNQIFIMVVWTSQIFFFFLSDEGHFSMEY